MRYESDFFLLRTPLLPFKEGIDLFGQLTEQTAFLQKKFSSSLLQEAIFLASTELYQQLLKYLKGELTDVKKINALEESLIEYLLRMSSRCTPFGLFAGITAGHFSEKNFVNLLAAPAKEALHKSLRLDTVVLSELARYYDKDPNFRNQTKYVSNSSIYKVGNKYRYHEFTIANGRRNYQLSEVDHSPILGKIFKKANEGIAIYDIMQLLISEGFETGDSEAYVQELIDSQLLISEIETSVIGDDFFNYLIDKVNRYNLKHKEELNKLKYFIENINHEILDANDYEKLTDLVKVFGISENKKGLFQVDLNRRAEQVYLSNSAKNALYEAARVLISLNSFDLKRTNLERFKRAFYERYEFAAVRLVDVMDIEIGINYKKLHEHISSPIHNSASLDAVRRFKQNKVREAVSKGSLAVQVTDIELQKLGLNLTDENLPRSFSVMAKILDEDGQSFQIESFTGPSFAKLMGRFCNSNEELKIEVEKMASKERAFFSEPVVAEIVHLPEDRIGNVINRPHLSDYEIPYLGKSVLPLENQIKITDLYLRMEKDRLLLFSKKLGKEIVPRLTSAHNFSSGSLPIYHFLCEMQSQGKQSGGKWFWDELENEVFLPRITYKNIVLSAASWNIYLPEVLEDVSSRKNLIKVTAALVAYFKKIKITKLVYYIIHDNKLLLDTQNNFSIQYLAKKLIKGQKLNLAEVLFDPDSLIVKSGDQGFVHELIIPFVRHPDNNKKVERSKLVFPPKLRRTFEPGSKWVYYKIYIGTMTASQLLYKEIFPLVKSLIKERVIERWFFIRYADPKSHLRIRFLLHDEKNAGILFMRFAKAIQYYMKNGLIANLQLDTYVREIERYGENTMELSEQYFHVNSNFICSVFQKINWKDQFFNCQLAFRLLEDMLAHFFPDMQRRHFFVNVGVEKRGLGKVPTIKSKKEEYNRKYRGFANAMEKFQLDFQNDVSIRNALSIHNNFIQSKLSIVSLDKNNENVYSLIASYVHMFANRFFDDHQNEMEGLLYFYLEKYYRAILGREKNIQRK